ncbi:hypothetical protein PFICI_01939 [Pestalotiopsis fici W106-1]|uniref:Uncharacterized protein n=1 Tax=Pestalotiopsis fici (strain W106-1 / CGMCC3.15140) TaxID=1229662 RepID=W3XSA7_PESFW|nr:uncharacterized protein PFICI_01939 [Pestalotiopsis fici W106-1]ETS88111.1 hypothetical protein PFICI_01939 [Pestalotiopsis fici W106-1]
MTASESAPAAPGIEIPDFAPRATTAAAGLVESPGTPSSPNAWARFEFEMGCGNEGTKVLVVEWDPAAAPRDKDDSHGDQPVSQGGSSPLDDWEVSWGGKIPRARNQVKEADGKSTFRVFILIEDDIQVPSVVAITQISTGRTLLARPMPAIYTPALGADVAKAAGRRGVLHTQWAEKRLKELQLEYDREVQDNSEGVGAVMAYTDLTWVVEHFGLRHPYAVDGLAPQETKHPKAAQPPRSPVGGKLGEKLRGLKLATSPSELVNTTGQRQNPHYFTPGSSGTTGTARSGRLVTAIAPGGDPGSSGVASLDAMVKNTQSSAAPVRPPPSQATEDELFALPMSPRSPEMEISPFSLIK